ncbi:MAG TPA: TRAP transporter large permease [Kofleriaceae bacterium]|nr:TRAP transporter large permease [Kofleriaceae bacterium]
MTTLLIVLLLIAFVSGAPLFTVMLGGAALGAFTSPRDFSSEFSGMVESAFGQGTGDQATVLSTIPLFIYAGYLLAESKTADRLVRFANAMLGWFPGGLAIVTILTCALFTVFTGASGVTIVALGGLLLPALVKQGYPERFSLGLIAGTGSVGLLFPPALPLFVYGTVYGLTKLDLTWDTRRFLFAGIVPGMVLVGMLSAVAVTVAIIKRLPRQKFQLGELGRSFLVAIPELVIPFAVIGGLAIGIPLPSVAALTVAYVVLLEVLVMRQIGWKMLWATSYEAMAMVGAIFIIIFASTIFTNYLVTQKVPDAMVAWTREHVESKYVFLLAINGILLLVGTVMDIFSAIVIVLPLIAPIAKAYGVDPYHLGVIFLLNLEVGYLHPPVGLNLFITSVKFRKPIVEVMWATIPFLVTMIVALLTITYVPQLTVVPDPPRTGPLSELVRIAHEGTNEATSVKDVALVLPSGAPIKDKKGAPITKHLSECESLSSPSDIDKCKGLFLDVTACRDKKDTACEQQAIASWAVANCAEGSTVCPVDIITTKEVTFVAKDGTQVKGADGNPIVRKLSDCDAIKINSDKDTCKELFKAVSDCTNSPPEGKTIDQCQHEATAAWITSNPELAKVPITVTDVALVDSDGKPVKKNGKAVGVKLADCGKPIGGTDIDEDTCKDLFIAVSSCAIDWGDEPTVGDCQKAKTGDWVSQNLSE